MDMRHEVEGVRLTVSHGDGVCYVSCVGLLTAGAIAGIRMWAVAAFPAGVGAVVMDYRRCVIAVTDAQLQALSGPGPAASPSVPLAWLVGDEATAELWRRQVLRLALRGQRRFATCQPEAALAWAEAQARLGLVAAQR